MPFVAVPTTAGTGAEVTRNAVLDVPEHGVKVSLRSPHLLARVAVVDPELTLSLPPEVTAYTGMDALTQLIEPFVSNAANPLTDGVCREGLARAARSLAGRLSRRVRPRGPRGHGAGRPVRRDRPGQCPARRGARVRGRPGRGHRPAHGALCARLLPFVMEANIRAVGERGDPAIIRRYVEIARTLTGDARADARDGVTWVRGLCAEMKIPPLREAGLSVADCGRLIPLARRASSMQGNPVELSDEELRGILEAARTDRRAAPAEPGDPGLDRRAMIDRLAERAGRWDVLVIGGGATGLGVAVDAAAARLPHGAARAGRLRQGHLEPLHQARPRRRALPAAGQRLAGAARRCASAASCAATRRTWCTTCASSCRTTPGGRRRSTASA